MTGEIVPFSMESNNGIKALASEKSTEVSHQMNVSNSANIC